MLKKLLGTAVLLLTLSLTAFGQSGTGSLKGKVLDKETGEPLPFVNVVVELNGVQQAGGSTNLDGEYFIKPLTPGEYTVKASFVGYRPLAVKGVRVGADQIAFADLEMSPSATDLDLDIEIVEFKVPLIEKDNNTAGARITKEELAKMPTRSATGLAETVGGVYSQDDGSGNLNVRGARADANLYFIDGIKVRGSNNLPQSAIEEVNVITGGMPAQYGDATGGVISITTRGPSSEYFGSMEYITSGYRFGEGDKVYGLDRFGYNLLEGTLAGPLMFKKDEEGNKTEEPLLGFFFAGNYTGTQDGRPSMIGHWQMKDDAYQRIREQPLRYAPTGTGAFQNAEYLRMNDFEKVRTSPNRASHSFNLNGKIDVNTGDKTNLTFGGNYEWRRGVAYDTRRALANAHNMPQTTRSDWRVYGRWTHRLVDPYAKKEETSSDITNMYYTLQFDFNQTNFRQWDENFQDDAFQYGYYGQFERQQARTYQFRGVDTVANLSDPNNLLGESGRYVGSGYFQETFTDTLIGFTPSAGNEDLARFTENYYSLFGWQGYDENGSPVFDKELASNPEEGGGSFIWDDQNNSLRFFGAGENFFLRSYNNIRQNGGLVNGDFPDPINNIWESHALRAIGRGGNNVSQNQSNQFRISGTGSVDFKNHNILLGFEFEQRSDRAYTMDPTRLWLIGRQRMNSHLDQLNTENGTVAGVFNDAPIIDYERLNGAPGPYSGEINGDNQSFFDYNVRQSLGLDPDGVDFVDFNSLTPDQLELEYFSTEELLNNGSELVSYFGYDAYGNKVSDNYTVDDFFNATDENGNYTRPVPTFQPIYFAGYIQDKFSFDDLIFNVGVRIDRFDANQQVLQDPYVLFPQVRAGEDETQQLAADMGEYQIPGNIGDDYSVYVDNIENPTQIVGYRSDNTWFNAQGEEISNGNSLVTSTGATAPLLQDKENTSSRDVNSGAFVDYTPQVNFMPRISFSFPISEEAVFFAHYDILTQRPPGGGRLNPVDYFFLEQRSSAQFINNPDLLPETTVDYSVGFKQALTNKSALTIEAFYREMRNQVQVIARQDAYPRTYSTWGNIDFGTVKGFTFTYDLRRLRTDNIKVRLAYTLQFAEGTGSTQSTAANLIRAGKANLRSTLPLNYDQRHTIVANVDYRYGAGKDYNGPIIGEKQILKNTGANLQFNVGSGNPFTRQAFPTGTSLISGGGSGIIDGSVNGSRLPWQFRIDARVDRDIKFKVGPKNKELNLNVYLWVLNVMNQQNILSVYRATGTTSDDGYLDDPRYAQTIASAVDVQAFREQYIMRTNRPTNFVLPRRARLGVILNF